MIVPDNMPLICPNNSYLTSPPQPCETSNFWTNYLENGPEGMTTVSPDTGHNTKLLGSGDPGESEDSRSGGSGPGGFSEGLQRSENFIKVGMLTTYWSTLRLIQREDTQSEVRTYGLPLRPV